MAKPNTPRGIVDMVAWAAPDWAGDAKEWKSQTIVHITACGCPVLGIRCRQGVQSLCSCEAEWHAGAR
eukprot:5616085-Pyramimonas_sp.AAC.1